MSYTVLLFVIAIFYTLAIKFSGTISKIKYNTKKKGIPFQSPLDNESLYQLLKSKFQYSDLKAIERNQQLQSIIYGKHGAYTLDIRNEQIFINSKNKSLLASLFGSDVILVLESELIRNALLKMMDENQVLDNYKLQSKLHRKIRNQQLSPYVFTGLIILIIGSFFLASETKDQAKQASKEIAQEIDSKVNEKLEDPNVYKVKGAYLTQFSSSVTIGDAFKNFFSAPKWIYKTAIDQKTVEFTGNLTVDDKLTTATVRFSIEGDSFTVSSLLFDDEEQSDEQLQSMLETIYKHN